MKTNVPYLKAIACLLVLLNSCTVTKNSIEQYNAPIEDPKKEILCFVQLKDGSVKNYTTLKLVTGVFKTPHLIADGSIIIKPEEIKAYQNKDHYAVSQKEFTDAKQSYVAKDALPGFAVRIAAGKINVYSLKYYNGHNTTEKLFLQSGDDAQIAACTPELMNELVKDNGDAYTFFNEKNNTATLTKKILATVEIYNNPGDVSKN
jgi:hypothetical protein